MKRAEREAILDWTEEIFDRYEKKCDECRKTLMNMCREYDITVTCSAETNMRNLLTVSEKVGDRAIRLYSQYIELTATYDAMNSLAVKLSKTTTGGWKLARPYEERKCANE